MAETNEALADAGAAANAAVDSAPQFGQAFSQAAEPDPQAARALKEVSDKAMAFGQDAFVRQLAAWQAIWTARTPTDLVRAQVAFGSESLETYLALTQHSSQLLFDLLATRPVPAPMRSNGAPAPANTRPDA